MKKINAWEQETMVNGSFGAVLVTERENDYEAFLEKEFHAPAYMFRIPKESTSPDEMILMAINQAESYDQILFNEA